MLPAMSTLYYCWRMFCLNPIQTKAFLLQIVILQAHCSSLLLLECLIYVIDILHRAVLSTIIYIGVT